MRKLIVALALFAFTAVASAETLKLEIKGMVCEAGCVTAGAGGSCGAGGPGSSNSMGRKITATAIRNIEF